MTYKIIGKYIKNLQFNIPNTKTFFLLSKDISNYKINININSTQIKQNIIEVLTSLSLTPTKDNLKKLIPKSRILRSSNLILKTYKKKKWKKSYSLIFLMRFILS